MLIVLTSIAVVLLVLYYKFKYFTFHNELPGLSPHMFFGNLFQSGLLLGGRSLPEVFLEFRARFGDVFQFWLGSTRLVVVSGVRDVEYIFTNRKLYDQGGIFIQSVSVLLPNSIICLKGAKYKRHAALTVPLMQRSRIISNLDVMIDCTDKLLAKWRVHSPQYVHRDIVKQCDNLLINIFGFIAFNYDLQTIDSGIDKSKNEFARALTDFLSAFEVISYAPRILALAYVRFSRRHQRAQTTIERYLARAIEEALAENAESIAQQKRTSMVASLAGSLQKDEKLEATKSEEEKKGLSRAEVLQEMVAFTTAAFETTSTALAWFIHLASKHPQVQQKIKAELMAEGAKQDLSVERIDSLVYLDCVINEVLRFSPPFCGTIRLLTADDCLPESGTQLYEGDQIFIPFHNLARDTRVWSIDPNLFYPERFLDADKNYNPYGLIPFGSGHRQCIGQDMARFELKVMVAQLMQHVTIGDGGPQVNSGGFLSSVTDKPRNIGVTIEFDQ